MLVHLQLEDIVSGRTKSTQVTTILRICLGLNMQIKDFFDDELFKDVDDDS